MSDFETIWERIVKFEGESFFTIKGLEFTYSMQNDILIPSRTYFNLTKENFHKAYNELPVERPGAFYSEIFGSSYVWAILNDKRIVG